MAYLVPDHYFYQTEVVSGMDSTIVMSLLEESQVEYCDDERLQSLIQSLQAEIDHPSAIDGHGSVYQLNFDGYPDECLSSDAKLAINSSASNGLEFNWIDMEMEMEVSPSSPCDDMISWYMENGSDHMDDTIEFEEVKDYSQICYRNPSEENVCSSFWHETYESVMHG